MGNICSDTDKNWLRKRKRNWKEGLIWGKIVCCSLPEGVEGDWGCICKKNPLRCVSRQGEVWCDGLGCESRCLNLRLGSFMGFKRHTK
jgi:hypothetical protein